jgi:type II secretory pathway pseudopilin PulG
VIRSLRARLAQTENSGGFSLVELLVAIMIFFMLAAMIGGMMISVTTASATGRMIDQGTRSAANAMNEISRMVRASTENPLLNAVGGQYPNDPAVQIASPVSLTLFAYVNLAASTELPLQVNFSVNAHNQLIETIWQATTLVNGHWSFAAVPSSVHILTDNIAPGSNIFGYVIGDGSSLVVPTAGLTAVASLLAIRSIAVTISILNPLSKTAPVTIMNTVAMPNLGQTQLVAGSS